MTSPVEQHSFQAEVKHLLDLMVHSLYSNKDIFLRELISNASDALDRLRFEQLTHEEMRSEAEAVIRINPDREKRTLSVEDNGIGMSKEELVENIGTIAKSGTKDFIAALKVSDAKDLPPELIGQFGVGFYSSFMVAEKVEVITRRAGEEKGWHWRSTGAGGFELEETNRHQPGTTIILHLKEPDEENALRDYTDTFVLTDIVKKYSDFVSYPIKMQTWKEKEDSAAKVLEEQVLNSQKAIWARGKGEVTEEEYKEFYKHISHDWNEPLTNVEVRIEGNFEAQALLFLPSKAPWDLFHPEMKRGVQLYVKRVFIMDECKELMPAYLRFVKGVVDAQDLSLNVSREILQKNRQIQVIRKQLVKKIFDKLDDMRESDNESYLTFWSHFGGALKEGLMAGSDKDRERILKNVLCASTHHPTELTTLSDYVSRMKEDQKAIYFLTGPSQELVQSSPHLEAFKAKGIEVLFFTDNIDELWLERGVTFEEKSFQSIGKGDIELDKPDEDKEKKLQEQSSEYSDLFNRLRAHLQEEIKEVRLSKRLTSSAACLVGEAGDLTPQMEKLMNHLGQEPPKVKRILELNPNHDILPKLQEVFQKDPADPMLQDYAELLYGHALLAEGGQLPDPAKFSKLVSDLMVKAV